MSAYLDRSALITRADGYVVCRAKKTATGQFMPDLALSEKLSSLEEAKAKLRWLTKGVQHKKPIRIFAYFDVET